MGMRMRMERSRVGRVEYKLRYHTIFPGNLYRAGGKLGVVVSWSWFRGAGFVELVAVNIYIYI